jgi:hypothetical protein
MELQQKVAQSPDISPSPPHFKEEKEELDALQPNGHYLPELSPSPPYSKEEEKEDLPNPKEVAYGEHMNAVSPPVYQENDDSVDSWDFDEIARRCLYGDHNEFSDPNNLPSPLTFYDNAVDWKKRYYRLLLVFNYAPERYIQIKINRHSGYVGNPSGLEYLRNELFGMLIGNIETLYIKKYGRDDYNRVCTIIRQKLNPNTYKSQRESLAHLQSDWEKRFYQLLVLFNIAMKESSFVRDAIIYTETRDAETMYIQLYGREEKNQFVHKMFEQLETLNSSSHNIIDVHHILNYPTWIYPGVNYDPNDGRFYFYHTNTFGGGGEYLKDSSGRDIVRIASEQEKRHWFEIRRAWDQKINEFNNMMRHESLLNKLLNN